MAACATIAFGGEVVGGGARGVGAGSGGKGDALATAVELVGATVSAGAAQGGATWAALLFAIGLAFGAAKTPCASRCLAVSADTIVAAIKPVFAIGRAVGCIRCRRQQQTNPAAQQKRHSCFPHLVQSFPLFLNEVAEATKGVVALSGVREHLLSRRGVGTV